MKALDYSPLNQSLEKSFKTVKNKEKAEKDSNMLLLIWDFAWFLAIMFIGLIILIAY